MRGLKQGLGCLMLMFVVGCGSSVEVAVDATPDAATVNVAVEEAAPEEAAAEEAAPEADGHGHDHGHDHAHGDGEAHACTCTAGHEGGTVWCDHCAKGYVDGEATSDKAAVDAALAES